MALTEAQKSLLDVENEQVERLKRGRPPKLTPEIQRQIISILVQCGTVEDAAYVAGIREATLYKWKQRGREQKAGIYRDFVEALERALVKRRLARELKVIRAGDKDWRATMAMMAVEQPERYAPRVRVHVEHELTNVIARIEAEFAAEPDLCDRVLNAIAGGHRLAPLGGEEGGETGGIGEANRSGGQALLPSSTVGEAGSVPKA